MKYLLKVKDKSGRDYSNVLSYKTAKAREADMRDFANDEDLSLMEIEDILGHLENGDTIEIGACEYEYMVQYGENEDE